MKRIISLLLTAVFAFSVCITVQAAPRGDVNGDGKVNSSAALLILQYSVGAIKKIDKAAADLNSDGKINSSDALTVLQISVGIISDAKYKAAFTLTAKIDDKTYTSAETIPVKAGQTVDVTLSLANNYYTGPTSVQIYYNKNIFSSAPSAQFNTSGRL